MGSPERQSKEDQPRERQLHPEGLTAEQEELADLLITAKTRAKVKRRIKLSDGSYRFYNIIRDTHPFDLAQEGEFAFKLHETDPAAPLSPEYFNFRNLPENVLDLIGSSLAKIPIKEKPDFCTGIPDAGVDLAKAYSRHSNVPYREVFRKIETEKGRRIVAIKGNVGENKKLLIVDDVVTKALSSFEAIEAVRSVKFTTVGILVIVDREQMGAEQRAKIEHMLYFVFKHSQLLDYYLRTDRMSRAKYNEIKAYLAASRL